MTAKSRLLASVRTKSRLWSAWRHVYASGVRSPSRETQDEVRGFQEDASRLLQQVENRLRNNTYKFTPARGVAQKRKGKSDRPIVQARVEDRIVQRAILDVLQEQTAVVEVTRNPYSFGGIKGRGVPEALEAAHQTIQNGAQYYIRSDIRQFFTRIPKSGVTARLRELIDDEPFVQFVEEALKVELNNLDDLGERAELFPLDDEGVAQGCCLSPLAGNLLLAEFDKQMNDRGITCLRYIDDFILLGPSKHKVNRAFESATVHLDALGLGVYDPKTEPEKADFGSVPDGFDFLGCRVRPGLILPSREARGRLLESVDSVLEESLKQIKNPRRAVKHRRTMLDTLGTVNNMVQGWGNQYAYCNAGQFFRQLDHEIEGRVRSYLSRCRRARASLEDAGRQVDARRVLGIHALVDSKSDPIIATGAPSPREVETLR